MNYSSLWRAKTQYYILYITKFNIKNTEINKNKEKNGGGFGEGKEQWVGNEVASSEKAEPDHDP